MGGPLSGASDDAVRPGPLEEAIAIHPAASDLKLWLPVGWSPNTCRNDVTAL